MKDVATLRSPKWNQEIGPDGARVVLRGKVSPQWIDGNGHMNVGYYSLVFTEGLVGLMNALGIPPFLDGGKFTMFTVEQHLTHASELREGEEFFITQQILDFDRKRIHYFQRMYHVPSGRLSATAELMLVVVDIQSRRVAEMDSRVFDLVKELAEQDAKADKPIQAGSRVGIRRSKL